jgi:transcriptional regulator with XRE-family HTH domain
MDDLLLIVGQQIKAARTRLDMNQEELAKKCGMEKADISNIENGKRNISLLTLQKVTTAIDLEIRLNLEEMFPDSEQWKKYQGNFNGIKAWIVLENSMVYKVILNNHFGARIVQNFDGTPWEGDISKIKEWQHYYPELRYLN